MSEQDVVEETGGAAGSAAFDADDRIALEDAGVEPAGVAEKEYSYRLLLDAGVPESVADDLRRRFSLPWSFETDGDLDRRSSEVSGLGSAERAWVAASADESWQAFELADDRETGSRATDDERPWPRPTPVTAVTGVGPEDAARLAEGGITSAERLATIDAFEVASVLDFDVRHVRTWRYNARKSIGAQESIDAE